MKIAAYFFGAMALLMASAACGDSDTPEPTSAPNTATVATTVATVTLTSESRMETPTATSAVEVPTATASLSDSPQGLYPQSVRTGTPVDGLLAALEDEDAQAAAALLRLSSVPCGQGIGSPNCEGKSPGTVVDAFRIGSCSSLWVPLDRAAEVLGPLIGGGEYYLRSAYMIAQEFELPAGTYGLIAATGLDGDVLKFILDGDGNVIGYGGTCGNPLTQFDPTPPEATVILAPPAGS
jgi:hypothetical protein